MNLRRSLLLACALSVLPLAAHAQAYDPTANKAVTIVTAAGVPLGVTANPLVIAAPSSSTRASYSISANVGFLASGDTVTLCGSSTKTINIRRISFSQTAGAASFPANVALIKRSSASTGGTSSAASSAAHDSTDAAATASGLVYTVAPTAGTQVGVLRSDLIVFQNTTTVVANPVPLVWTFSDLGTKGIILRGAAQCIALQSNAAVSLLTAITWTEE